MRGLVDEAIDGELDSARRQALERHLQGCPSCRAAHEAQTALSAAVRSSADRFTASEALRSRVRTALAEATAPAPAGARWPRRLWTWLGAGSAAAGAAMLAAGIALFLAVPSAQDRLGQELVAAHVRSLMADHLADVRSSDRHTVKPWFNGRLDLSPPVADLAAEGYPLIGGRLDYLDQRPVAAQLLAQRRRLPVAAKHVPAGRAGTALDEETVLGEALGALIAARFEVLACRQERSEIEDAFVALTGSTEA